MKSPVLTLFTVSLVTVGSVPATGAQTIVGRISGVVTDPSGAVVPGATVTVTSEATGQPRTVVTGPSGFYLVTDLPAGDYTVAVEIEGFRKAARTGNSLVADGRLTVDFALEPGGLTEAVFVTAW